MNKYLSFLIKPASSGCNMRCKYCFYTDVAGTRAVANYGMMSLDTAETLVRTAFSYAPRGVSFAFQGGEPTLRGIAFYRTFVSLVARYNTQGARVDYSLQTNGLLIEEDYARFFADNHFLVGLSLDGDKDTNDKNRVDVYSKSVFNRVLRAADILTKYNVDFNILSVVTNHSARFATRIYSFFKSRGFVYLQFIPAIDDFDSDTVSLTPERYLLFLNTLYDAWYSDLMHGKYVSIRMFDNYINILRGAPPENCGMSGRCGLYYVVESDGSVYPCDFYCVDRYLLGNIADEGVLEGGSVHAEFLAASPTPQACKTCRHFALCRGGCRRDRESAEQPNKYCTTYQRFLDHALPSMRNIAMSLGRNSK